MMNVFDNLILLLLLFITITDDSSCSNQYQSISIHPFLALFISHNLPTNHSMIAKAALIPRELSQAIPSIHSQSTDMDISLQS